MNETGPLRMCIACRARRPQRELLRLTRRPDGRLQVDEAGRAEGRGAYVCPEESCLAQAVRRQAFRRALGGEAPEELADAIRRIAACRRGDTAPGGVTH